MSFIDWINQLLVNKKHWDEFTEDEQKKFSPFIINRWLSMDKDFIEIVNMFQPYAIGTLEPKDVYEFIVIYYPKVKDSINISKVKKIKNMIKN